MPRGAPVTLLRKVPIVAAAADRLPVFTLTFSHPPSVEQFRMDMGDVVKIVVPAYKPKSYSVSAMRDGEFDVTFKVYPNGRASGYLDRLAVGDEVFVFRKGRKVRVPGRLVGIVAYGVGATEAVPIAEAEVAKGDAELVTLLWASRTVADTFWGDRLESLAATGKFRLVSMYSREFCEGALHGRVTPQVLRDVFGGEEDIRFLIVGTKEMMAQTDLMLADVGYPMPATALLQ
ncbi:hypothetical protein CTAYLR_007033 [Chrysophaeum taylorii]|uniref:FAD-binding FR-type domain-containing protein n=1 Tax=Chrysophaeum taylorii TaxID=2483200 RepID=A0AAD7XKD0_9STRA|nr:hypothetical protein CTAYLR_007033 [Chrysophaeum taylorii]